MSIHDSMVELSGMPVLINQHGETVWHLRNGERSLKVQVTDAIVTWNTEEQRQSDHGDMHESVAKVQLPASVEVEGHGYDVIEITDPTTAKLVRLRVGNLVHRDSVSQTWWLIRSTLREPSRMNYRGR